MLTSVAGRRTQAGRNRATTEVQRQVLRSALFFDDMHSAVNEKRYCWQMRENFVSEWIDHVSREESADKVPLVAIPVHSFENVEESAFLPKIRS